MKPGDLLEWDQEKLDSGGYSLKEHDAVSPFVVIELDEPDVKVMDSRGKINIYTAEWIEPIARIIG